ncbi:hypothetical protein BC826DRAFT_991267 [Russula brevipes]|nr:hypothetical protein BC826DRAFT_991267 [Russula brevipes]
MRKCWAGTAERESARKMRRERQCESEPERWEVRAARSQRPSPPLTNRRIQHQPRNQRRDCRI